MKVEPTPHAISPGGVSQLGEAIGNHVTNKDHTGYRGDPFKIGRGFKSPLNPPQAGKKSGSQGSY